MNFDGITTDKFRVGVCFVFLIDDLLLFLNV